MQSTSFRDAGNFAGTKLFLGLSLFLNTRELQLLMGYFIVIVVHNASIQAQGSGTNSALPREYLRIFSEEAVFGLQFTSMASHASESRARPAVR